MTQEYHSLTTSQVNTRNERVLNPIIFEYNMYICMYVVCMYVCLCVCVYIYIYIYSVSLKHVLRALKKAVIIWHLF